MSYAWRPSVGPRRPQTGQPICSLAFLFVGVFSRPLLSHNNTTKHTTRQPLDHAESYRSFTATKYSKKPLSLCRHVSQSPPKRTLCFPVIHTTTHENITQSPKPRRAQRAYPRLDVVQLWLPPSRSTRAYLKRTQTLARASRRQPSKPSRPSRSHTML